MNRLNHSFEAYHNKIRRLSPDNRLFVFVEGKINDPYFYGEICRSVCQKVNYTIRQAREIPGETGGKPALIAFFRFIKENSGLINEFEGKKTGVIFF